jgi:membrane protein DedA with SNARE-associated domain/pimeloyl-ACP methyl ester carboxylesterase
MSELELPERLSSGAETGEKIRLAYYDVNSGEKPVVILVHGSPVASPAMRGLLREMEKGLSCRYLVPDLPGLGSSESPVADYSAAAHAHSVFDLMDALEIKQAHLLGYSMGGGVILEMAQVQPDRVQSLMMAAAIGVQEYELFGSYELNHSVHWLQWIVLKAVDLFVPHFGYFDRQPLNLAYARNFLDTDQRPLRVALKAYQGPMLIQHGRHDFFVPAQAAVEHARLVPQAELVLNDGDHLSVIHQPARSAGDFVEFIQKVEDGEAMVRQTAKEERIEASEAPFVRDRSWRYVGLPLVLVAMLLMAATLVSEDLTCIGAGLLASNGLISLPVAIAACFTGIFFGDLLLYLAGRTMGREALARRPLRWVVSPLAEKRAEAWFARRGVMIILISRFLPGTRAATYFSAGVLKANFGRFLLYFGLAAAIWTPLLVGGASVLGEQMQRFYNAYETYALPTLIVAGLGLYLLIEYGLPALEWRGRRLLLGKWRRLTRWEYWPLWFVNAPVFYYVLCLVFVRYRKPTIFTLCNPGMPHGGFIGESKSDILGSFPDQAPCLLQWDICPLDESIESRMERLKSLQARCRNAWPIVIKPDEGQRGLGVNIVHTEEAAREALSATAVSHILQEYSKGPEYGVFYYRFPGDEEGCISSITMKDLTSVVGDGKHTLEELILLDDRAVDRAAYFLEIMQTELNRVPDTGERVTLVSLGTHARGATFYNGADLLTDELKASVEEIAQSYSGFYYGRFDFKAPSEESFRAGRELKVIELNGLTSEPTHIYAPGASLFSAWKTLMWHWHTAIRIGIENEKRGLKPSTPKAFVTWWWKSYFRQRKQG